MAIDPKELMRQFADTAMGVTQSLGGDSAVDMVRKLVSTMEKTLSSLEKYLGQGKDKLKEVYDKSSASIDEYRKITGEKLGEIRDSLKEKGVRATLKDKASEVKTKLREAFSSDAERANGPPDGEPLSLMAKVRTKVGDALKEGKAQVKAKGLDTAVFDGIQGIKKKAVGYADETLKSSDKTGLPGLYNKVTTKAKELLTPSTEPVAKDGLFSGLIGAITTLSASILKLNTTSTESNDIAKEEDKEQDTAQINQAKAGKKQSAWDRMKAAFDKQKQRALARGEEVSDEKAGAKVKGKPKGIFGSILAAITGLGGIFLKGIGSLITFLPGLLLKGIAGTLTTLVPMLVTKMAALSAGAITSVAGTVIGAGAKVAGALALKGVGVAAAAVFSPVGLAIVGTAAALYGGYKLYKYLNRNNLGSGVKGKLTRMRMMTYGYNDTNRDHYSKVLDLDMLMQAYVNPKNGKAVYTSFDKVFRDKVVEIFEIKRDDKEKYKLLNTWFMKRYVVAHAAFMNAYYGAGGTAYLDDLDKLSDEQCFQLVTNYRLPVDVHEHKTIPVFENPNSVVTKDEIDVMLASLRQEVKTKSETLKGVTPEEEKRLTDKRLKEEEATRKAASDKLKNDVNKTVADAAKDPALAKAVGALGDKGGTSDPYDRKFSNQVPPTVPDPSDRKFSNHLAPGTGTEEGEKAPPNTEGKPINKETPLQSSIKKVAAAGGPLVGDNQSLTGISVHDIPMDKVRQLDPNLLNLFSGMAKEYHGQTGKNIMVNEAFRTRADQERMRRIHGKKAAGPGTSLHEFGIALDISSQDAEALDNMGLMRKYGFTRPVSGEPWHLEPAGISLDPHGSKADANIRLKNIMASPGRGGGGFGTNANIPDEAKFKRNIKMQRKLFEAGESIESPVEINPKQDSPVSAEPLPEKKPQALSKPEPAASKPMGLDQPQAPVDKGGPQLQPPKAVKADPAPPVSEEGESPPTKDKNAPTGDSKDYSNLPPEEAILKASQVVGVDHAKLLAFAKLESSLRPGVKNSISSATGLFQIVGTTWNYLLNKHGPMYNLPENAQPSNPYYNSVLGAAYAKDNMKVMDRFNGSGIRQDVLTYLAHHYGPGGGPRIVKAYMANPDALMKTCVSDKAYTSNLSALEGKTIKQYINVLTNKLNNAGSNGNPSESPVVGEVTKKPQELAKPPSKPPLQDKVQTGNATKVDPDFMKSTGHMYPDQQFIFDTTPSRTGKLDSMPDVSKSLGLDKFKDLLNTDKQSYPLKNTLESEINKGVSGVTSGINKNISDVTSGINSITGGINRNISGVTGGINQAISSLSRGAGQMNLPPQPSAAMSLDKTESLLTGMGDTLSQIKSILQAIHDKPGAMGGAAEPSKASTQPASKEPPKAHESIRAPNANMPSTEGVSLSRRSVLT